MGKAEENKLKKRESLLNTAFELFTTKGIHDTSISDIVEKAGVAKGTFYLYFKDKYDINNKLVAHRATKLFDDSLSRMRKEELEGYREKIIFVIDDIIDSLAKDKTLLMFISKNLGLGFSRYAMERKTPLTATDAEQSLINGTTEPSINAGQGDVEVKRGEGNTIELDFGL